MPRNEPLEDACSDCGVGVSDVPKGTLCACHCPECGAFPRMSCQCEMDAAMRERLEWESRRSICEAVEASGVTYLEAALDLLAEDESVSREQYVAAATALGFEPTVKGLFVELGERAA